MPIGISKQPRPPPPEAVKEKAEEFPFDIFKGPAKSIKTGVDKIDEVIDCIEDGINIVFGEWDTGKTTLSLQLLMNALEQGMTARYIDTELGVHPKRLMQIYKGRGYSFPLDRLAKSIIRLSNWDWYTLRNKWLNILEYEKPELFVVDSVTPVFLDTFFNEKETEHYKTLQSRDTLATGTMKKCEENHTIVVLIGHEKAPVESGTVSELLLKEATAFSGLGRRFSYLAKIWIYTFKEVDRESNVEKSIRYLALQKHRYMPTFTETGKAVKIRITERGIEAL